MWTDVNRCKPLWIVAKPFWTVVNRCKATSAHISWIYSQGRKQKNWFLWVATVPEKFCVVSDSLCHATLLLLSSVTAFIISKFTHTNSTNQNLPGLKFGSLLWRIISQTRFAVFQRVWAEFVLSESPKCCSALKQPLMRGDWKRVCGKLYFTALKPPNPDLKYN